MDSNLESTDYLATIRSRAEEALASHDVATAERIYGELQGEQDEPWRLRLLQARILTAKGRVYQAIRSLRSLPVGQRQEPEVQLELGRLNYAQGQLSEARTALQSYLKQRDDQADAWLLLAEVHRRSASWGAASNACSRAIALDPENVDGYLKLGQVLQEGRQFERAIQVYANGLKVVPNSAELLCDMGAAQLALGEAEDAIRSLRQALRLRPLNIAAVYNLGSAFVKIGQFEEAQRRFGQVLRLRPGHADAWYKLMHCRRQTRDDQPAIHKLNALTGRRSENTNPRLWFALGKALDDLGQYDDAFSAFARANELRAAQNPHDCAILERAIELTTQTFSDELIGRLDAGAGNSPPMIFIVGLPRSGSTLLSQILDGHPNMTCVGEHQRINWVKMAVAQPFGGRVRYPDMVPLLSRLDLSRMAADYLQEMPRVDGWLVDQSLEHFQDIGLLHLLFPHAWFIDMRRDPRDCGLSMYFSDFSAGHAYSYRFNTLARHIRSHQALMEHWHSALSDQILRVRYEHLVSDLDGQIGSLTRRVGAPAHPDPGRFYLRDSVVNTGSAWQVRQPLYEHSVGRWRNYAEHLEPFLTLLEE
ncbi:MAG: sulfotransferase [Pseudomonadota bacterium]